MMKAFQIFLLVIVFTACSHKDRIPDGVLTQPQMQAVLWDVLRTDEFVMNYMRKDSVHNKKDESTRLYSEVFRIHKTTREEFKKSLAFYNSHPDLLKVVFDSLENRKAVIIEGDPHRRPMIPMPTDTSHRKLKLAFPKHN